LSSRCSQPHASEPTAHSHPQVASGVSTEMPRPDGHRTRYARLLMGTPSRVSSTPAYSFDGIAAKNRTWTRGRVPISRRTGFRSIFTMKPVLKPYLTLAGTEKTKAIAWLSGLAPCSVVKRTRQPTMRGVWLPPYRRSVA
jgi:hypothetical protein